MRWSRNTVACGIALGALAELAVAPVGAQAPQPPSFSAAIDAVRLDTRVVAADGTFVRGLTKDDFRVFEDGKEQAITAFSMMEIAPTVTPAAMTFSTDVSSNASFRNGRVYLLVLDDLHIHELRAVTVRELARRFIEQHTMPVDRVAIATTSGVDTGAQDFTNDRPRLLGAVAQFKARIMPEAVASDLPEFAMARAEAPADAPKNPRADRTEVLPLLSLLSSVEWLGTGDDEDGGGTRSEAGTVPLAGGGAARGYRCSRQRVTHEARAHIRGGCSVERPFVGERRSQSRQTSTSRRVVPSRQATPSRPPG